MICPVVRASCGYYNVRYSGASMHLISCWTMMSPWWWDFYHHRHIIFTSLSIVLSVTPYCGPTTHSDCMRMSVARIDQKFSVTYPTTQQTPDLARRQGISYSDQVKTDVPSMAWWCQHHYSGYVRYWRQGLTSWRCLGDVRNLVKDRSESWLLMSHWCPIDARTLVQFRSITDANSGCPVDILGTSVTDIRSSRPL